MTPRMTLTLLAGLAATALLVGLGVWQLQRLAWKEAILADIEARIAAEPVPLPAAPDPAADRYLPVRVAGTTGADEILVQASLKLVGPGFRVIAPFETEGGRRLLLDRGFVPLAARDTPRPPLAMTVTGNLHWPDEVDGFTPDPDPQRGMWFARDVAGMAAHLGTEPLLLVARASDPADPAVTPMPVTADGIPNNHLGYAVQWFLIAAVCAIMTLFLLRSMRRSAKD